MPDLIILVTRVIMAGVQSFLFGIQVLVEKL